VLISLKDRHPPTGEFLTAWMRPPWVAPFAPDLKIEQPTKSAGEGARIHVV
jgi:hypothetical protein